MRNWLAAGLLAALCVLTQGAIGSPRTISLAAGADIQVALDALAGSGGEVVLAPGIYTLRSGLMFPDTTTIVLRGAGREVTILRCYDTTQTIVTIRGSFSALRDLSIEGPGASGPGVGISIGSPSRSLTNVSLENLFVQRTASSVLIVGRPNADSIAILTLVHNCFLRDNASAGPHGCMVYLAPGSTATHFSSCSFTRFTGNGIWASNHAGVLLDACDVEEPHSANSFGVLLTNSNFCTVRSTWFENTTGILTERALATNNCVGVRIADCNFNTSSSYPNCIMIGMNTLGYDAGVRIENCWANVQGRPTGTDQIALGVNVKARGVVVDGGGVVDYSRWPGAQTIYPWKFAIDCSGCIADTVRMVPYPSR